MIAYRLCTRPAPAGVNLAQQGWCTPRWEHERDSPSREVSKAAAEERLWEVKDDGQGQLRVCGQKEMYVPSMEVEWCSGRSRGRT